MKNTILVLAFTYLICLWSFVSAQNQNNSLEIQFPENTEGYVILRTWGEVDGNNKIVILDSAKISNNSYLFKYNYVTDPVMVYMDTYLKDSIPKQIFIKNNYINRTVNCIWLDNENSTVKVDPKFFRKIKYSTISGSITNDIQQKLVVDRFQNHIFTNMDDGHLVNFDIIKQNPKSLFLLQQLEMDKSVYLNIDSVKFAMQLFDPILRELPRWKSLDTFVKNRTKISSEGVADKFVFYDVKDKKYNYKDFIGKKRLGLIVFWASWCGPCIKEIPTLKDLYCQYGKNVAFASLSIDTNEQAWKEAVKKYKLGWYNLAGFPDSKTKVAETFNVNMVPVFMLVNSSGKVLENALEGYIFENGVKREVNHTDIKRLIEKHLN